MISSIGFFASEKLRDVLAAPVCVMKLAQNTRNAESSPGGESVGRSVGCRKEVFEILPDSRDSLKKTQSWINWQKGMKMSPKPRIYEHFEDITCGLAQQIDIDTICHRCTLKRLPFQSAPFCTRTFYRK